MNRLRERRFLEVVPAMKLATAVWSSATFARSSLYSARAFPASWEFERSKEAILSSISSASAAVALVIWLAFATTALAMRLIGTGARRFFPRRVPSRP